LLYYDRSIITEGTIHNNRPDIIIIDKTIKEAYVTDVTIPNSHNRHSTITEKRQKCTDLKEELIRMWQLKTACIILLVLSTKGIIPIKLSESVKLFSLRPGLYILTQQAVLYKVLFQQQKKISQHKAVLLNACRMVRTFLAEQ
jgi:hypothetical protein